STTVSGPRSVWSTEPAASRSLRSVSSATMTSPLSPWGLAMVPTSSRSGSESLIGELHVDLDAVLGGRGAHDGADGLGGAATTADDPAGVAVADRDGQLDALVVTVGLNLHLVGLGDDGAADVLADRDGG